MKQVLIYFEKDALKPVGGPSGYLYNFYQVILEKKITNIHFLESQQSYIKAKTKSIYLRLPKKLLHYIQKKNTYKRYRGLLYQKDSRSVNLKKYDLIHFHSTAALYQMREQLKEYKGKVVLTSHTPKAPFREVIEDVISKKEYKKNKQVYDRLELIDKYAFQRADVILFPCKEAEEPYFQTWENYKNIRSEKKHQYLLTGSPDCRHKVKKPDTIRKKYHIPNDAFVISFVGRHNTTKGYDSLLNIGEKLLKEYKDIYFLIAGKEEPLKGLSHERWIEVGWTNDPYSIIYCSDLFILPNKQTFFDLVLLEVLSLGKNVLLSETGGDRKFKEFNSNGINFFKSEKGALEQVERLKKCNKEQLNKFGMENRRLYETLFTMAKFLEEYEKMVERITKQL